MLKKDFTGENSPQADIKIRPMEKNDADAMIGMTGIAAGQNIAALRAQYRTRTKNSFVASDADGKIIGFIVSERHAKEFPNGIGITNLAVDPRQNNAGECLNCLVRAMARHCLNQGQHSMDLVVFDNDQQNLEICNQYAARKCGSHKGTGPDGRAFIADFYTIDDLFGKFGPARPSGPNPKP